MRCLDRRDFLKDAAFLATALAGGGAAQIGRAAAEEPKAATNAGALDPLRVAVVGVNGRGMSHVGAFASKLDCVITTICDVDEGVIGRAMKRVEGAQGKAPKYEKDLRRVVEDKNIDIVTIATPNHWHSLAAIWALQNGKDVYCEKPVSHNVSEGRRLVETARKYHRICQTGTQIRSSAGIREAMDFLHQGGIGKITVARGLCYKSRGSIGKVDGPQAPPKTCDYDLWCGPAPVEPLMRKRLHYDWHWVWSTGNGDLGNQGIHQMDVARWGLGKHELAQAVLSVGGRFGYVDDGQTANTQICVFDYGDSELIFEVRGLRTKPLLGATVGNIFHGSDGYLVCPSEDAASHVSAIAYTPKGEVLKRFSSSPDQHFANFVKAVRSRKAEDLNADILEGHLSSALCHLGNISYRLGKEVPFNPQGKALGDDQAAAETFARMQEHLKDNALKLEAMNYRLGRRLVVDPKTETFVGDKEADAMLTRAYRKGFEVPAKV